MKTKILLKAIVVVIIPGILLVGPPRVQADEILFPRLNNSFLAPQLQLSSNLFTERFDILIRTGKAFPVNAGTEKFSLPQLNEFLNSIPTVSVTGENTLLNQLIHNTEILYVSSEMADLSRTGGLGDVTLEGVNWTEKQLTETGRHISRVLPFFKLEPNGAPINYEKLGWELSKITDAAGKNIELDIKIKDEIFKTRLVLGINKKDGVVNLFLDNEELSQQPFLKYHGDAGRTQAIWLSRAVLEAVKTLGINVKTFHLNDWQSGLIAAYLRGTDYYPDIAKKTGVILTVHNPKSQGRYGRETYEETGLPWDLYNMEFLEFHYDWNMLKAIVFCDKVYTVSPTYAIEMQEKDEAGHGLQGVFKKLAKEGRLEGVLNGIDPAKYRMKEGETKQTYKKQLQRIAIDHKGSYKFQVDEFKEQSLSAQKLAKAIIEDSKSSEKSPESEEGAVNWLNESILPYKIFNNFLSITDLDKKGQGLAGQIENKYDQALSEFSDEALKKLAETPEGQQFKSLVLRLRYPQRTPKSHKKFKLDPKKPLIGTISRIDSQKGLDLLAKIIPQLVEKENMQIVIVGTAAKDDINGHKLEKELKRLEDEHSENVLFINQFDGIVPTVYGALDMFLMPSDFEPCGLGQMIAMCKETIPIVRATGGLDDTVIDYRFDTEKGNGFKFISDVKNRSEAVNIFLETIKAAKSYWDDKKEWKKIKANALNTDSSWESRVKKIVGFYDFIIKKLNLSSPSVKTAQPHLPQKDPVAWAI